LHKILEECDHVQGFHVFSDIDTGFGGITEDLLSQLRQDLPKAAVTLFGFYGPPKDKQKVSTSKRILNLSLSMSKLTELCSLYVPLSYKHWKSQYHFPYLKWEKEKQFHTSSIFAAAIDTLSRPYRITNSNYSMGNMTSNLATTKEMNIASLEFTLPLPLYFDQQLETLLNPKNLKDQIFSANWMYPLTPNTTRDPTITPYSSSVVMRGVPANNFAQNSYQLTQHQLLENYLVNLKTKNRDSFVYTSSLHIPISFPQYFSGSINPNNGLIDSMMTNDNIINSVPVLSHLQTTKQQIYNISLLGEACGKVDLGLLPEYELGKDDFLEHKNKLFQLQDLYAGQNYT